MLYDLIVNQPHRWYKECAKDLQIGVPYMGFTPALVKEAVPFLIDDVGTTETNACGDHVSRASACEGKFAGSMKQETFRSSS